ncbi:hypothetical protein, partial [Vibrio cholerae]|uniref:hypothetical protein n=1 Tax=Vibrio cholerae TaxID=666 RepID=UPI00197EC863
LSLVVMRCQPLRRALNVSEVAVVIIGSYDNPYARASRYLERIKMVYEGVDCYFPSAEYFHDDVYSFFIFCFHIKDWLKSDTRLNISSASVEAYIKDHIELQLCADICNGTKHFVQTPGRVRTGEQPMVYRANAIITTYPLGSGISPSGAVFKSSFGINTNGEIVDVLELGNRCMELWSLLLEEHGVVASRESYI